MASVLYSRDIPLTAEEIANHLKKQLKIPDSMQVKLHHEKDDKFVLSVCMDQKLPSDPETETRFAASISSLLGNGKSDSCIK